MILSVTAITILSSLSPDVVAESVRGSDQVDAAGSLRRGGVGDGGLPVASLKMMNASSVGGDGSDLGRVSPPERLNGPVSRPTDAALEPVIVPLAPPPAPAPVAAVPPPAGAGSASGVASWYCCSAGFAGQAVVSLPAVFGGRYTGGHVGYVTVCGDKCARLPVVDQCGCHWGTADQRVADLSPEAWAAVSNSSLSRGLVPVTLHFD